MKKLLRFLMRCSFALKRFMKKLLIILVICFAFFGVVKGCAYLAGLSPTVHNMNKRMADDALKRFSDLIVNYEKVRHRSDMKGLDIISTARIGTLKYDRDFKDDYWVLSCHDDYTLVFVSKDKKVRLVINDIKNKHELRKKTWINSNGIMNLDVWRGHKEASVGVKLHNVEKWDSFAISHYNWIQGFWFFDKDGNVVDFVLIMDSSGNFWSAEMGK